MKKIYILVILAVCGFTLTAQTVKKDSLANMKRSVFYRDSTGKMQVKTVAANDTTASKKLNLNDKWVRLFFKDDKPLKDAYEFDEIFNKTGGQLKYDTYCKFLGRDTLMFYIRTKDTWRSCR